VDYVADALEIFPSPFKVFITTSSEVALVVDGFFSKSIVPILHFSSISGPNRVPFKDAGTECIDKFVKRVLNELDKKINYRNFVRIARESISGGLREERAHPLPQGLHNVVAPNEIALIAFGRSFSAIDPISQYVARQARDPQKYINSICRAFDAVVEERRNLLAQIPRVATIQRMVIAVPSVYWGHYRHRKARIQRAPADLRNYLKQAYREVLHAQHYADADSRAPGDNVDGLRFMREIRISRGRDMRSFTAGLTAISAATLTPVLRLESRINSVRVDVRMLALSIRSKNHHYRGWKESRLVRKLGERMRGLIAPEYIDRINERPALNKIEGIKVIADLPIELMPVRGVPLGLRFDVSRDSPVPGNMFIQNCIRPSLELSRSAFKEILIIRSYESDDPVKYLLERAIRVVMTESRTKIVGFRFVDVSTPTEFVNAIQGFGGAVVVFDGHGVYSSNFGAGSLVIGGRPLDMWAMRGQCDLPPILMLSACDTLPIDGSHSSVAGSAFNLGAHTVLATLFPIDGIKAAEFTARFLYRLVDFIPVALRIFPQLSWREVVSGMLRMTHCTEILEGLMYRGRIDQRGSNKVQLAANIAINNRVDDWHERFVDEISTYSGLSVEFINNEIQNHFCLTDAMKYVQLGSPENIIIVEESASEIVENFNNA